MTAGTIRPGTSAVRRMLWEAAALVAAAMVFGFGYTAVTAKGLFARSATAAKPASPRVISYEEAKALHDQGGTLFVDARPPFDFGLGHIKGAVNLPLKDFSESGQILELMQKDQPLVTYCDGENCNSSLMLAAKLDSSGYKNVRVFFGGWKEWSARHQAVE